MLNYFRSQKGALIKFWQMPHTKYELKNWYMSGNEETLGEFVNETHMLWIQFCIE